MKMIGLALSLIAIGCAHTSRMSKKEVIAIAKQAGEKAGYHLDDFREPEAHFEYTRKDHTWTVYFQLKPPTPPGGFFWVHVDDQTGHTEVAHGE